MKNVNKIVTKNSGEPMAKFELEDFTGTVEIICFPRDFIKFGYKIFEEGIVMVEGYLNQEGNKYSVVLSHIHALDELSENKFLNLYVLIDNESRAITVELNKLGCE